jgi:Secretion system C-terminal sorting domain
MGTWNVTGHQLVAKYYNGQYWLVQRIATGPEKFLVRGSEMLTRSDVTLANSSYSSLVGCFGWTYSGYGGLQPPTSAQFATPAGWQYGTEPDGTPFYTSTGGTRLSAEEVVQKEQDQKNLSVYPNPNTGSFTINTLLKADSPLAIDLISTSGTLYASTTHAGKQGENQIAFTAPTSISPGLYLIRVKSNEGVKSTIVVIEK